MIKEIYNDRRGVKGSLHTVVICHIVQTALLGISPQLGIQCFPVKAAAVGIDFLIQPCQYRMLFLDVVQNHRLIAAPEVEVFQPDQLALIPYPADDRRNVGDAS